MGVSHMSGFRDQVTETFCKSLAMSLLLFFKHASSTGGTFHRGRGFLWDGNQGLGSGRLCPP